MGKISKNSAETLSFSDVFSIFYMYPISIYISCHPTANVFLFE